MNWWTKTADAIPGGLSEGCDVSDFDPGQIAKGIKVELEHTRSRVIAREIALDHLVEDAKYYDKLEKADL